MTEQVVSHDEKAIRVRLNVFLENPEPVYELLSESAKTWAWKDCQRCVNEEGNASPMEPVIGDLIWGLTAQESWSVEDREYYDWKLCVPGLFMVHCKCDADEDNVHVNHSDWEQTKKMIESDINKQGFIFDEVPPSIYLRRAVSREEWEALINNNST